jgi:hypothetical protein
MPVAPNTSSSMIVRTASNPTYTIYNLGQNQILLGQDVITSGQLGSDFNFAGPGAVMWDFNQFTLDLWGAIPVRWWSVATVERLSRCLSPSL